MKTERDLFEDAMQELSGGQTKNEINPNTGEYLYGVMEVMWKVWQASAQREGYKLVPVEPTDEMINTYRDKSIAPISTLSVIGYKAMIGASE